MPAYPRHRKWQSIQRYHSVQILELSMQGFLSNLVFEILQNAVDDGALNVRFQVTSKFQKRTIGFMCIGLKVVYKRFSPATCSFGLVLQPQWKVCKRPPRLEQFAVTPPTLNECADDHLAELVFDTICRSLPSRGLIRIAASCEWLCVATC